MIWVVSFDMDNFLKQQFWRFSRAFKFLCGLCKEVTSEKGFRQFANSNNCTKLQCVCLVL